MADKQEQRTQYYTTRFSEKAIGASDPSITQFTIDNRAAVEFHHLLSNNRAMFKSFITTFNDDHQSEWTEENLYGRMDSTATFKRTSRTITIEFDVPSFIYLSGVNLFSSDLTLLDESAVPEPRDLYLLAKWVGEQTSNLLNSKSNTSFLNLRVSAPYGPNWKNKAVIPLFLEKTLNNEPITLLGTGKREQVFTYVDDIANATMLGLQKKLSGTYNLAGNQTVNMQQLASAVIKAVPKTKSEIIYTGQSDPNEDQKRIVPINKIKDECGWEPTTSLFEGVQKMVREINSPQSPFYFQS